MRGAKPGGAAKGKTGLTMKLIAGLLVSLAVLAACETAGSTLSIASVIPNKTSPTAGPIIKRIRLKGNKLIVAGENFDEGAIIFINDEEVVTRNDLDSPTTTLIAKKGGKKIPFETIFGLRVETFDGERSFTLKFFRTDSFLAPVLPMWPYPFTVYLRTGEYLLVRDLEFATRWITDPGNIKRVFDVPLPLDRYWLFQAVQPGVARFYAERDNGGDAPPELLYDIPIIVE